MTQRIDLTDLTKDILPYESKLMRMSKDIKDLLPENTSQFANAAAKTAKDILARQGITNIDISQEDSDNAEEQFMHHVNHTPNSIAPSHVNKPATALKLEALVQEYDWRVIQHADQIRMLVTNKLLELSDHRDAKVQLKAVELLGKLADVGMFVEKQEITYKQKTTEDLQQQLREKLSLLIEGEVVGETILSPTEVKELTRDPDVIPLPVTPKITTASIDLLLNT